MTPWPHQTRAIEAYDAAVQQGHKRIVIAAPTGAGKGYIIEQVLERATSATLYTDRRMLLDQTSDRLTAAGFEFGVRAAGHDSRMMPNIQLCMIQTEDSRVLRLGKRDHHRCATVIVDEAHRMGGAAITELLARHTADGSVLLGVTATPLDLSEQYDHLIVAATTSDCRACGALVAANTYAPDEPDLRNIKRLSTGEFEVGALARLYKRPVIFGRVLENWKRLNTDGRPTLLFGPDVDGAKWFCEQLNARGIPSGHIDGEVVIIKNEVIPTTTEARQQLHDALKAGDIQIVTNRYVLREGIDWPWVSCMVFATAFGSLTGYLQSGGRGLRSAPGKSDCLVIDHGGNYHRHGSLNSDREWVMDKSDYQVVKEREERMRMKASDTPEPVVCPKCTKVRLAGKQCPSCGFLAQSKTRMVIEADGTLREVRGDIYKPRRVSTDPKDIQAWKQCYFRCRNAKRPMTFNQAAGLFFREHGKWPNSAWPLMPKESATKYRAVRDVPIGELHSDSNYQGAA